MEQETPVLPPLSAADIIQEQLDTIAHQKNGDHVPKVYRELKAEISFPVGGDQPPQDVLDRMRELYAASLAIHKEIQYGMSLLDQHVNNLLASELCDIIFALRETTNVLDDAKKMMNASGKEAKVMACHRHNSNPLAEKTIKGDFCRGRPDVRIQVPIPTFDKDPENYYAMMNWLGIPTDLQDRGKELLVEGEFETEIIRPNWKGFQDMINKYHMCGHVLPPFIDANKQWTDSDVIVTKTGDLL